MHFDNQLANRNTGFCRIFATGMFQTSSKCYDRAVLLWSRPIVLATTLPNKEGSWSSRFCCKDSAKPCTRLVVQGLRDIGVSYCVHKMTTRECLH